MNVEPVALLWIVALLLVGGGFLVGLALGRSNSKLEARCRELESALEQSQATHAKYREEVGSHFGKTSELLRDLTLQYRAVYEHLAEGAQTLCPDLATGLPAGGVAGLLAEASEAEAAARATVVADAADEASAAAAAGTNEVPPGEAGLDAGEAATDDLAAGEARAPQASRETEAGAPTKAQPALH